MYIGFLSIPTELYAREIPRLLVVVAARNVRAPLVTLGNLILPTF